jgi:micrococcal nuclease
VWRVALLVLLVPVGCSRSAPTPEEPGLATVVEVLDGDTVVVDLGGGQETVRLIGVDTPETHHPDRPVECFGPEASDHTARLLPDGTAVRLTRDREARDRYDRFLAYVHRADDGLFVNLDLVEQGFADAQAYAPNLAHQRELQLAEATARAEGRGLWAACGGADTPAAG